MGTSEQIPPGHSGRKLAFAAGYARLTAALVDPRPMFLPVFHFDRCPGVNLRLFPRVAALMATWMTLPLKKLTVARSECDGFPGPCHVHSPGMQLVLPHWWNTCVWLIPILTPAIEVPGAISVVFGLGNRATAAPGQVTHPTARTRQRLVRERPSFESCQPHPVLRPPNKTPAIRAVLLSALSVGRGSLTRTRSVTTTYPAPCWWRRRAARSE